MQKRWETAALVAIIIVTLVRVAATHRVFSAVIDEPVHIGAGFDWLVRHSNKFDSPHPPLARIVCALPIRDFHPPSPDRDQVGYGDDLLYAGDHYERNLAAVRRGNLLFLLIALVATWWWASRTFSRGAGLLAVAFLGSMPPILGHAGVVTTDMAVAAMLPIALIALAGWLAAPTWRNALLLGGAIGLGLVSKFSFIVFFPACGLAVLATQWRALRAMPLRVLLRSFAIVAATAFVVLWGTYFFEFETMAQADPLLSYLNRDTRYGWFIDHVPLPATLYWVGLDTVRSHNAAGHLSYFLGEYRETGWWYYFPVIFFFKTPLPFQILMIVGAVALVRRRTGLVFVLMPLLLLASVLNSKINIGIRHILPIYPPLCVVAACGAIALWRWRNMAGKAITVALAAWLFVGVAVSHPDYLAWFNEAAGKHPEHISVDSNLDWGQDILRLGKAARRLNIDHGAVLVASSANIPSHGFPALEGIPPFEEKKGWLAVSETALVLDDNARKGGYAWLKKYEPVERVGRSIRLYHIK